MAQTGYTPILIYSSSTASNAPAVGNLTNSTLGSELAINITDGKLFYKDNANAIQVIGWKTTPTTAGGTGLTSYTAGDLLYYATGTTFSKLAIGTAYQALQVNAGATAPSWQPSATSILTTQGDLLYASAANTLARLAKSATATRYLSNTGASNNPAWAQIDLTNGVTGTLPIANGGTGQTSFTAGYIHYGSFSTSSNLFWDATNNRLGINTTTPSDVIGIGGNTDRAILVERTTSAGTSGSYLQLKAGGAYSGGTNLNGGDIFLYTGTSTGSGSANMRFFTATPGSSGTADNAPTEKVRFWGTGAVSIGTTSLSTGGASMAAVLDVRTVNSSYGLGVIGNASNTQIMRFAYDTTAVGSIVINASTTTYNTISDQDLKNDLGVVTETDVIANTVIHDYEWKVDGGKARGPFAQEAHKVNPYAVTVGNDELDENGNKINPWQIDLSKYIPDIIVELQSLRKRVAELEAKG